ncbi:MAG: hypothetical protein Q4G08_09905, partial [Capnocytophaga sp.]|nr:hypothetical protein [Capnocytophaga sp.]
IGENLAQGTRLSKQGFQVSGASYGSEIIDNIYGAMNDYNYGMVSSNGVMTITFPEQKKIKSIRFDMRNDLRSVDISTRNGTVGAFTTQGTARVSTPGKWFVIIFSEAVDASQIQFSKFITTTGGSASIHEMDFYTE